MLYSPTRRFLLPLLTIVVLIFAPGCSSEQEGPTGPDAPLVLLEYDDIAHSAVDVETIDEGTYGDITERTERVIRDQSEFESFWKTLHGQGAQYSDEVINFSEEIVLAVVLGERPTGGYEVKIEGIVKEQIPPQIVVTATEVKPGPDCTVSQAKTVPYHIVKMDAPSTDQIRFEYNDPEVKECS